MLTDRPPRSKSLLAKFAESDRLAELELPSDDRLRVFAQSIESLIDGGTRAAVSRRARSSCLRRLVLRGFETGRACAGRPAYPSPGGWLGLGALRGLHSRHRGDPNLDAYRRPEETHFVGNIFEHALPRVLPPPRLRALWISSIAAHAGVLLAHGMSLPPRARVAAQTARLGAHARKIGGGLTGSG